MALTLGAELVEVGLGAAHCSQAVLVLATAHQAAGLAADSPRRGAQRHQLW
jgi:hypothetical protein|eukprot:COSAG01_NODE_2577_length_7432_cov_285.395336_2_plen_51_part_00